MEALIVSSNQDTNGQNARYVEAAKKHGDDVHVLNALAVGNFDPAGVVERFRIAGDKYGTLKIRSAHKNPNAYTDFPVDIEWTNWNHRDIVELAKAADVIHLNNSWRPLLSIRVEKPMLMHHHGTLFRNDPGTLMAKARQIKAVQAVSTFDLRRPDPDQLHWLPTAYDLDVLMAIRDDHFRPNDGRVRIVHAPTTKDGKNTSTLEQAVRELVAEGLPIDLIVVRGVSNAECLRIKATADIVFDQLAWGYGCNAVEAWGMGIPVISGADAWTTNLMKQEWGGLPYANAKIATLKDVVRRMVESADMRAEWAAHGRAHFMRFHDDVAALGRLAELYHKAMKRHVAERLPVEPVTFISKRTQRIGAFDVYVLLEEGKETVVTDPWLVKRLRLFAKTRPSTGIIELEQETA